MPEPSLEKENSLSPDLGVASALPRLRMGKGRFSKGKIKILLPKEEEEIAGQKKKKKSTKLPDTSFLKIGFSFVSVISSA